jgi:hypothetical protein
MIWFKINNRYYIDITQIREFGMPSDIPDCILITFKDGHEDRYQVDDQKETFERLARFVEDLFNPVIMPKHDLDSANSILSNSLNTPLEAYKDGLV